MLLGEIILVILIQHLVIGYVELLARHWDVKTTQGIVRGYYKSNPPHFAFLGVPYARPPTGYDRFKAPKPPVQWDGIFEAIYRLKCPQDNENGSEDCLVLNFFIPDNLTNMPVLVHFHDGFFQSGWGYHHPPPYFIKQGIIVVTVNYRIGAPGFLCLQSPEIPGNAGLKDQVAALYWIHRNIIKFNGNPQYITVYGTGSGSVSIEILLLSGIADGLFQKAILESGSVLSPSSITYSPVEIAMNAAIELGYQGDKNTKSMETFFQAISVMNFLNITSIFVPCIEKITLYSLFNDDPMDLIKFKKSVQIPMLIVYSDPKEIDLIDNNKIFQTIPENFGHLLPNNLAIDTSVQEKVAKLTKGFYFGNILTEEDITQCYRDYVNDIFMEYPVVKSSAFYAYNNSNPVFLMKFSQRENEHAFKGNYGKVLKLVFSDKVDNSHDIGDILKNMWSNFIKLGDPTPITTSLIPDVWMPVEPNIIIDEKVKYHKINYYECGEKNKNKEITTQQFTFWEHIYMKFYKNHKYFK
ncbi:unnamed protein product [Pieris macdunnoughi]|uniref:Carboxylesterase type B domain-containing protein n=1 Tax=Pieris macdunnoughi TaxID=345717 RepID=A0A821SWK8_9NEOP|nr:unnamed protein product [Pieris macdunnoughi]